MLKAEWRQVLRGSLSMAAKEDELSTGRIWAAGFHHVTTRSRLACVLKPFISLIFHFLGSLGEPRITDIMDTESVDTGARQHFCTH
jgi:hypothetical protein